MLVYDACEPVPRGRTRTHSYSSTFKAKMVICYRQDTARHHKLPKYSLKRPRVTDNCALVNHIQEISRRVQFLLQDSCIVYCAQDMAMETQYMPIRHEPLLLKG